MPDNADENSSAGRQRALIGAGVAAAAAAGAAAIIWGRKMQDHDTGDLISDAPPHVLRGDAAKQVEEDETLVGKRVTVSRPRQDLYDVWKDFTRFPDFMENVRSVQKLDSDRSKWTIKGPAGYNVELVTRIVEDEAGRKIAWESEEGSEIDTAGIAEFTDAPPGRGTYVRLLMSYDPPGGAIGRGIARLLQREPNIQARRDLRRFKQLMETGEVTVNASPSARKSEAPTEARI